MNFIQFIATKRFLKLFAISIFVTLIFSWITLLLLRQYTKHGEYIEVPQLAGLPITSIEQLENIGKFELVVVDSVYDYTKTGGTIVSQDPQPASKVKPGRNIYLSVVSFLPEQVKMPALVDLSIRQAKALLQTYNLRLGFIKSIPDPAKNAVLQVSWKGKFISPGTLIPKGSIVDLYIGSGTGGTESLIPFLIGKTRTEALSDIVRLGLMLGEETFDEDADSLNARVYLQSPMYVYGQKIPVGTTVNLTYRSPESFDFENYINSLEIDTIQPETLQP